MEPLKPRQLGDASGFYQDPRRRPEFLMEARHAWNPRHPSSAFASIGSTPSPTIRPHIEPATRQSIVMVMSIRRGMTDGKEGTKNS